MGNTRPYTEVHAVAMVDVALLLDSPLSAGQIKELRSTLLNELKEYGFSSLKGRDRARAEVGLVRRGIENERTEELHIHRRFAHLAWYEYRGWTFTRDATLQRLATIVQWAREGRISVSALGLVFKDVFVNDDPGSYDIADVFQPENKYLPPIAYGCGGMWEQEFSWFVEDEELEQHGLYSSLQVEARVRKPASKGDSESFVHVTELHHRQQIFFGNKDADPGVEWSESAVKHRLDVAHRFNKTLLGELLSDEMIRRIGLKD
ncbi:hypothetical protein [Lysobacter sp. Root983]|uniref:hypothetical protein n=1 Tax=Lysobacter sp. Root983 TaxID=1736613 RepID=UPI0012F83D56|nr:hypothetical protein [Lysobacter sp. Root983]